MRSSCLRLLGSDPWRRAVDTSGAAGPEAPRGMPRRGAQNTFREAGGGAVPPERRKLEERNCMMDISGFRRESKREETEENRNTPTFPRVFKRKEKGGKIIGEQIISDDSTPGAAAQETSPAKMGSSLS